MFNQDLKNRLKLAEEAVAAGKRTNEYNLSVANYRKEKVIATLIVIFVAFLIIQTLQSPAEKKRELEKINHHQSVNHAQ